jgi:CYTH domain-containing protein
MTPIETERKFLIRYPDISLLENAPNVRIKHIEQTYLLCENGKSARVRKICEGDKIRLVKTVKERISILSAYEDEFEIDESRYAEELKSRDPQKNTIIKTRYCIPFDNHLIEIDIFPFWTDRAILEVELGDEKEEFSLPDYVYVIKEVSDDPRYKNTRLAKSIPTDEI